MNSDDLLAIIARFDALDSRLRKMEVKVATSIGLLCGVGIFNVINFFLWKLA